MQCVVPQSVHVALSPVSVFSDLYLARSSIALCSAGYVDRVAKETVARHSSSHYPSHHRTTVDADSHLGGGGGGGGGGYNKINQ